MYIAIDFDGTCVTHDYPEVGKDIGAVPVLKALVRNGHKIILNTMRDGKELGDAVAWCMKNGIELFGANDNYTQHRWTTSPKVYANLYIDDAAMGCFLCYNPELSDRPYVDWKETTSYFHARGLITYEQYSEIMKSYE
jgi:hypothetical protein